MLYRIWPDFDCIPSLCKVGKVDTTIGAGTGADDHGSLMLDTFQLGGSIVPKPLLSPEIDNLLTPSAPTGRLIEYGTEGVYG